ncbi:hypothetical protein C8J56DRAFT_900002 [Mycena floridula]|nr:hypothetical protein C8J56DRAFT_900002 [Mycena floridula]
MAEKFRKRAIFDKYTGALTVSNLRWERDMEKPRGDDPATAPFIPSEGDMMLSKLVTQDDEIILNNWLLCLSGNPNSFMEVDLVQEHMNYWIKVQDLLIMVQWDSTQHSPPDLTNDINRLITSLDENNVYRIQKGRVLDDDDLSVVFAHLQACRRMTPLVGGQDPVVLNALTAQSSPVTVSLPQTPSAVSTELPEPPEEDDDDEDSDSDELAALFDDDDVEDTLELTTARDISFDMDNDMGDDFFECQYIVA